MALLKTADPKRIQTYFEQYRYDCEHAHDRASARTTNIVS